MITHNGFLWLKKRGGSFIVGSCIGTGCGCFLAALTGVCGLVFVALWAVVFNCDDPRFGDFHETRNSLDRFYQVVGASDYARMPLRYPYEIVDLYDGRPPHLECQGEGVMLDGIAALAYQDGWFVGCTALNTEGNSDQRRWFVLSPGRDFHIYESDESYSTAIQEFRKVNLVFYDVQSCLKWFYDTQNAQPLFDVSEMRRGDVDESATFEMTSKKFSR